MTEVRLWLDCSEITVGEDLDRKPVRIVELMMELLAERALETVRELLPVDLVIRGTTGPAPP